MNQDRAKTSPPTRSLSRQQLEAITEQSRLLFLEEEAPENLAILKQGISDLLTKEKSENYRGYTALIRAAHTLKGGAGIAQLPNICQLAHQLEDLFEQLIQYPEDNSKIELIAQKFQEIYDLINQASLLLNLNPLEAKHPEEMSQGVILSPSQHLKNLTENYLQLLLEEDETLQFSGDFSNVTPNQQACIKTAISVDLETGLQRLEALLQEAANHNSEHLLPSQENYLTESQLPLTGHHINLTIREDSPATLESSLPFYINLKEALTSFAEEITLLSEVYNLSFLGKVAEIIITNLPPDLSALEKFLLQICTLIRQWKEEIIKKISLSETDNQLSEENKEVVKQNSGETEQENAGKSPKNQQSQDKLTIPERFLKYVVSKPEKNPATPASLTLRVPVEQLDRLSDSVGELFINYQQLSEYQQQLSQTSRNLKKQIMSLRTEAARRNNVITNNVIANSVKQPEKQESNEQLQFLNSYPPKNSETPNPIPALDLEFPNSPEAVIAPKFNENSHEFYELVVQIYESRADMDLLASEIQETLDRLHNSLQNLNENLTQSRLVNFGLLTDRFQASLQNLNQQYDKTVELVVKGKDLLIDQALLQQLHTPLTHLFRNAFDHGIETTSQRVEARKPKIAKIFLSAQISANYLTISLEDDGRGIDTEAIYRRAKEINLIAPNTPLEQFKDEEILEFLFTPGFSTATTKSDLSGRGFGLDIVRYQIARMRGTFQVETRSGVGTKFTINVPFKLRIVKLLLCRCGSRTLAIPCLNILGIIDLSEKPLPAPPNNSLGGIKPASYVVWNEENIRAYALIDLLPYGRAGGRETSPTHPTVGLVLEVSSEPIIVAVDAILQERELVIKSFDETVPVPAYLAGCTVLGSGEIVPVISPHELNEKITLSQANTNTAFASPYPESNSEPANLRQEENHPASPATIEAETQAETLEEREIDGEALRVPYCPLPAAFFPSKPAILIADDSIAVRRALDQLLSGAGYQVTQCNDGKAALEELKRSASAFDLVISDLEMPRMNGLELLANLRAHPNTRNLPVAILSSRDSEQCRQRAASCGVTAYFTKPWEPASLLDQIAALLS
ncbi:response regulator [Ancylothrix sp. C2]|uniref:response regulator n=1 Tax=Ancylothrix sp. D3o TaxID=2953691 RepID=UPI0021BAF7D0|nr:response regulator [Ancylothrix sp. D3o]MCT7951365.1 response regulator [Ancylothrix sp. D3o]